MNGTVSGCWGFHGTESTITVSQLYHPSRFTHSQALHKVGTRHGVPGSSVALRWVLDQPGVAAAAVGARNAAHVRAAQTAFSFALTEDDHLELDAAYEGAARQPRSDVFQWERGGEW